MNFRSKLKLTGIFLGGITLFFSFFGGGQRLIQSPGRLAPNTLQAQSLSSSANITLLAPNGQEAWKLGSTQLISWQATGVSGMVTIALSTNGGRDWEPIGEVLATSGQMTWVAPEQESYHGRIQVTSRLNANLFDASDADFYLIPAQNRLSICDEKIQVGASSIKVEIALSNDLPVSGLQFDVFLAPVALKFQQATLTGRNPGFSLSATDRDSLVRIILYDLSARTIAAGFGPILTLDYQILPQAPIGTPIALILRNVAIADSQANRLPVELKNGNLLIQKSTAVEDRASLPPANFELELPPAYPNPFQSQIHFQYRLETPERVQIKIFNLLGQEIIEFIPHEQSSGDYLIYWDGRDREQKQVRRGLYLVQFQAGTRRGIQKILYIP